MSGNKFAKVTMSNNVVLPLTPTPRANGVRMRGEEEEEEGIRPAADENDGNADTEDGPQSLGTQNVFGEKPYAELMNTNQYNVRKMASQTLIDVALMMANISQLRTLISLGEDWVQYYQLILSLVVISLVCQVIFAILMFVMWIRESDLHQKQDLLTNLSELEQEHGVKLRDSQKLRDMKSQQARDFMYNRLTSRLNYVSMFLVFTITVINMFITGFSIKVVDNGNP